MGDEEQMTSRHGIEVISRGVCIVDDYLLLCHGRGHTNTYLPGGHIEKGESAATALVREIREELGVKAHVGRFLGVVENQFEQKGHQVDEINLLFELEIPGLEPGVDVPVAEDWLDFRWERLDNLVAANVEPKVAMDLLMSLTGRPAGEAGWASNYDD